MQVILAQRLGRFLLPVLAACLLSAGAGAQEQGDEWISPEFGFQISRADESWRFHDAGASPPAVGILIIMGPGAPGTVQGRVTVLKQAGIGDAAELRAATLRSVADASGIGEPTVFEAQAAEGTWPALEVDQTVDAGTFHARQVYLEQGPFLYVIQFHAPADSFAKHEAAFDRMLASFRFTELGEEAMEEMELVEMAARVGSGLDWAESWEAAAERSERTGRPILVYVRSYPGFALSDDAFLLVFSDPDLTGLIGECFVPLRWKASLDAPFQDQDSYGMGPSTFGNSLLVVNSAGEVLADTYAGQPAVALYEFLRRSLRGLPGAPCAPEAGQLELAQWHARRGELEKSLALLDGQTSLEALLLRARALRLLRQGEPALEALDEAAALDVAAAKPRIERERAFVLMGLDREEEATSLLERLAAGGGELGEEARFLLSGVRLVRGGRVEAERLLRELVAESPESPWGWAAAAGLQSTAMSLEIEADEYSISWPSEALMDAQRMPEPEPLPVAEARTAQQDVLAYLLENQREDGSWICPTEIGSEGRPNHFTLAITAICGEALLPFRDDERVGRAVRDALGYVLASWSRLQVDPSPAYFMDHTVWSDGYLLSFLGACSEAGIGKPPHLLAVMQLVVDDLARLQKSGGGWSYYLTPDATVESDPLDISMSFTTAAVLLGIHRAQEAGAEVPEDLVTRALDCLQRMENPNGTFEYLLNHGAEDGARQPGEPGAAGRGPVCALALHEFDRVGAERVAETVAMFARHRAGLAKERRKTLMHCGPGAQGSHYVFFDYFTCAAAIAALPADSRALHRDMLLGEILAGRNADGSYLDNPMIGPAFASGAALQAFHDLLPISLEGENR